ncbi:MAG: hypothetical protein ACR2NP_19905 [Pirellulaceae bacterium]
MSTDQPAKTPSPRAGYEFDAQQNQTIGELAGAMKWVAVPLILVGAMYAVLAVIQLITAFQNWELLFPALMIALAAVLYLVLGFWTKQSSEAFSAVVATSGNDIGHLMTALDNLRKKYSLLSLIVKIYVVLLIIGLIVGIVMLVASYTGPPAG